MEAIKSRRRTCRYRLVFPFTKHRTLRSGVRPWEPRTPWFIHPGTTLESPRVVGWRRYPRWRGDYPERHLYKSSSIILEVLPKETAEVKAKHLHSENAWREKSEATNSVKTYWRTYQSGQNCDTEKKHYMISKKRIMERNTLKTDKAKRRWRWKTDFLPINSGEETQKSKNRRHIQYLIREPLRS